ncbi:MAG: DUF1501 domain-containing protein [Planctomycetota bacterium]
MPSHFDRRQLGQVVTAAGLSTCLGNLVSATPADSSRPVDAPFRRCVTLWMEGGPSQLDTIDPKPDSDNGGPLSAVSTRVPGMQLCETFSGLGTRADDLCLLRSVGSRQGEHQRATHLMHTGFERVPSFPRPSLGAYVASRFETAAVPGYVTLGDLVHGSAFLGTDNGPFVINDLRRTRETIQRVGRRTRRLDLIGELNERTQKRFDGRSLRTRDEQIDSVRRLLASPFRSALDLESESESTVARYGESDFGRKTLVARRLLEAGVKYVEVQLGGWDTHVGNFPSVRQLCQQVEPAWLALMDDLKSNGMWQDTLIIWMGEFGRTPNINSQRGRDHYPQSIPVALAGHGIGGRVIGSTGKDGRTHDDSHSVADLMYTLMTLLGVDADREYSTDFDSPTTATDNGRLIPGILS